jgi:hypothetical protein
MAVPIVTDGTGSGLLGFLGWAGDRGEIPPGTAKSMAVAAGKVLAVDADPDGVDVRHLDPEDLFGRFETLNRLSYTSESLKAYRSRFFRSVSMYLAWLDKRPDWKSASYFTASNAVAPRSAKDNVRPRAKRKPKLVEGVVTAEMLKITRSSIEPPVSAMVPYDLPLRPGLRVRLVLPEMLTQADAKRISAFVDSLAFDQAQVPTEGTE